MKGSPLGRKITPVLAFILKKDMVFLHNGNRGIVLDESFPWLIVRMFHEMKPRKLWACQRVLLLRGSKYASR